MKPNEKIGKPIIKGPTEFDKQLVERLKTEFDLISLNYKLKRAHEWIPIMQLEQPDKDPKKVLDSIRTKCDELGKTYDEFLRSGIGQFKGKPRLDLGPPGPNPLELKEKIKEIRIVGEYIDKIRELQNVVPLCPTISDCLKPNNTVIYNQDWFEPPDHKERVGVNFNYIPDNLYLGFNGGIVFTHHVGAALKNAVFTSACAMDFTFPVPAPLCEGYILTWEVDLRLGLQYMFNLNAQFTSYNICVIYYEQPDGAEDEPDDISNFVRDNDSNFFGWTREFDSSFEGETRDIHLIGSFPIPKHTASKLKIGVFISFAMEASDFSEFFSASWFDGYLKILSCQYRDDNGVSYTMF